MVRQDGAEAGSRSMVRQQSRTYRVGNSVPSNLGLVYGGPVDKNRPMPDTTARSLSTDSVLSDIPTSLKHRPVQTDHSFLPNSESRCRDAQLFQYFSPLEAQW